MQNRSLTIILSALAFTASAAYAQTLSVTSTSATLGYAKLSETVVPNTTIAVNASVDATAYTAVPAATWLSATPATGIADTTVTTPAGDMLTIAVVPVVADAMAAGVYTSSIALKVGSTTSATVSVTLTITSSLSPLSTGTVSLTYIRGGVANQPATKYIATILDNDTAADTYGVTSGFPTWLTVAPAAGHASLTSSDTVTFTVVPGNTGSLSLGVNTTSVHLTVTGQPDLVVTVNLTVIAAQPLLTTTTGLTMNYVISTNTLPTAPTASITVASGTQPFTLDPATVPAWITVTSGGTATTSGQTVTFTPVSAVVKGLAAGNYSGSVGFLAVGATSELVIPIVLTVSNVPATISLKGTATNPSIYPMPGSTTPTPVVTVISSDEPVSFSAACVVTTTNPVYVPVGAPCSLAGGSTPGATVSGIAYTYGTPLTTTFDSTLFSAAPFGTVITLTVTVTAGTQSPVVQSYAYTVQPIAPTFTALSPTSAAQIATGESLVVTLTGTNFVGPNNIVAGSSLSRTKVFAGGVDITSSSVIFNSTTMVVSVPAANFPAYPTGKTTVNLALGVANQIAATAPTVAQASQNLVITQAPVIYGITSTATYNQPNPGVKQSLAPYELISIFGANFAPGSPANGNLSAFSQFGNTVNVSGLGTTASPFVTLSVTFKVGSTSFPAPVLFANGNQINCIVPSTLPVAGNANVTVAVGTTSSDGLFGVSIVASDPGIFTISSQGTGQGAILNADYSVNGVGNEVAASSFVSIYMTGLGIPNSTAVDATATTAVYSTGCVQISNTTAGTPGYLQVVNTSTKAPSPVYTAPSPAWTNIDGAVILPARLLGHSLAPCFVNSGSTAVSVTFGSGGSAQTVTGASILYAGFATGSVAGLYQVIVTIPSGLAPSGPTTVPVYVTLGPKNSPVGVVTMAVK